MSQQTDIRKFTLTVCYSISQCHDLAFGERILMRVILNERILLILRCCPQNTHSYLMQCGQNL